MTSDEIQINKLILIGKLSASLLHEIRNPLSAIQCNLDYLKMIENELTPDALDSVQASYQGLTRINYLVEGFLNFAKIGQNGYTNVNIEDVTRSAVQAVSGKASKSGVTISTVFSDDLPEIFYNKTRLLQVFLNLLTNALGAMHNGGKISIKSFYNTGDSLVWQIEDNGEGIPARLQGKIFDDFFTCKADGTGLGLSICKMLLDEINSKISFISAEGVGTTFTIQFSPDVLNTGIKNAKNNNY